VAATDFHEAQEHAAHVAEHQQDKPVAFTMSVLAVLVAITTILAHRTQIEVVVSQTRATDNWNLYQARKIRQNNTEIARDLLGVVTLSDKAAADKLNRGWADHDKKWNAEIDQSMADARQLEGMTERAERKAERYDLGDGLLEIGLVITSVTLLTQSRIYWYVGMGFALAGVLSGISAFFLP